MRKVEQKLLDRLKQIDRGLDAHYEADELGEVIKITHTDDRTGLKRQIKTVRGELNLQLFNTVWHTQIKWHKDRFKTPEELDNFIEKEMKCEKAAIALREKEILTEFKAREAKAIKQYYDRIRRNMTEAERNYIKQMIVDKWNNRPIKGYFNLKGAY